MDPSIHRESIFNADIKQHKIHENFLMSNRSENFVSGEVPLSFKESERNRRLHYYKGTSGYSEVFAE